MDSHTRFATAKLKRKPKEQEYNGGGKELRALYTIIYKEIHKKAPLPDKEEGHELCLLIQIKKVSHQSMGRTSSVLDMNHHTHMTAP